MESHCIKGDSGSCPDDIPGIVPQEVSALVFLTKGFCKNLNGSRLDEREEGEIFLLDVINIKCARKGCYTYTKDQLQDWIIKYQSEIESESGALQATVTGNFQKRDSGDSGQDSAEYRRRHIQPENPVNPVNPVSPEERFGRNSRAEHIPQDELNDLREWDGNHSLVVIPDLEEKFDLDMSKEDRWDKTEVRLGDMLCCRDISIHTRSDKVRLSEERCYGVRAKHLFPPSLI